MWQQIESSRASSTLFRLACAVVVSSGVSAFAPIPTGNNDNIHKMGSAYQNSMGGQHWVGTIFPSHSTTQCEALARPGVDNYKKMPRPDRGQCDGHVIYGLLLGDNMIESYDVYKRPEGSNAEDVIIAYVKLGDRVDGHPGVVHGGILSLIFDDALGFGFEALGVKKAFTANLTIDYRSTVPSGASVRVTAQLEQREGRKLFWKAQMTSLDGDTLYAEATSLYIIPRSHA